LAVTSEGQIDSFNISPFHRRYRFRVTQRQAAEFAGLLDRLRPSGSPQPVVTCHHYIPKSDPSYWPPENLGTKPDLVITWSDKTESRRFDCDADAVTMETVRKALWAIGLYEGGIPRPKRGIN